MTQNKHSNVTGNAARALARATLMALVLVPQTALAAQRLSAAEFEAYSTGKTLTYGSAGQPYGIEQYMPGRRVVWAFLGDDCRYGSWYEDAGRICFVYENDPAPQCWEFTMTAGGLRAHFAGDPAGLDLIEVEQTPERMHCPGPDVGA